MHTDSTYQTSARPQVKGSDVSQRYRVVAEFEMVHTHTFCGENKGIYRELNYVLKDGRVSLYTYQ